MWQEYVSVHKIEKALEILAERKDNSKIIAGGTDLVLEIEQGVKKDITTLIDISRIPGLDRVQSDKNGVIHIGPMVTHNHCASLKVIREKALPLAQAAWKVGSPQIRNRGTIVGNLVTASPANDTITPLMALNANLVVKSIDSERIVPLDEFYKGVRKTILQPDEMVTEINFPAMQKNQKGIYLKYGLRKAQAISVINLAIILSMEGEAIVGASITLGSVAPMISHAREAEAYLVGKVINEEVIEQAAMLVLQSIRPIDDIRSSGDYRKKIVKILFKRGMRVLAANKQKSLEYLPEHPILLWGNSDSPQGELLKTHHHDGNSSISTNINGKVYSFSKGQNKTLLALLRDEALLTGTKEGCGEGECGACTVFLDGRAVMACLVPAVRAHGAEITTIEGIAPDITLHPVQKAFIDAGAVQCGYCTPGFIMSAIKLLEENPNPSRSQIKTAISGNLCRCTGYYKIIQAIEQAAQNMGE